MMRGLPCLAGPLLLALVAPVHAADVAFPDYDIAAVCRVQANYAFAATLGDADQDKELAACSKRERDNKSSAQALWPLVSAKDASECLGLADGRYGYLTRCLDASRSMRAAR